MLCWRCTTQIWSSGARILLLCWPGRQSHNPFHPFYTRLHLSAEWQIRLCLHDNVIIINSFSCDKKLFLTANRPSFFIQTTLVLITQVPYLALGKMMVIHLFIFMIDVCNILFFLSSCYSLANLACFGHYFCGDDMFYIACFISSEDSEMRRCFYPFPMTSSSTIHCNNAGCILRFEISSSSPSASSQR